MPEREQNGFRCQDQVLYNFINNRNNFRKSTYACFVDAKKAFDTVNITIRGWTAKENTDCYTFVLQRCKIYWQIFS